MGKWIEVIRVNLLAFLAVWLTIENIAIGFAILASASAFVYNSIKIYQSLKKKDNRPQELPEEL